MRKPVVLVLEADVTKGGYASLAHAMADCPLHYRDDLFRYPDGRQREAIAWHRVKEFQLCALKLIAAETLAYTPQYAVVATNHRDSLGTMSRLREEAAPSLVSPPSSFAVPPKRVELCLRGEIGLSQLRFFGLAPVLYSSPNNPGARSTVLELIDALAPAERPATMFGPPTRMKRALRRLASGEPISHAASELDTLDKAYGGFIMILYLNERTWAGEPGEMLANEVRLVRESGIRLVMLHENVAENGGCPFSRFFQTTPGDLIDDGLYDDIALALHAGDFRHVSLRNLAQTIGASTRLFNEISSSVFCRVWRSIGTTLGASRATFMSTRESQRSHEDSLRAASMGPGAESSDEESPARPRPPPRRSNSSVGSFFRGVVAGTAVLQVSGFWTMTFSRPSTTKTRTPTLFLHPPLPAASVHERVLFPHLRRSLEFITVQQPTSGNTIDLIAFVNLDPVRQSVVSCECLRRVRVVLLKTQEGVVARTLDLVVAEDPAGPRFVNWTVVELKHFLPRPVEFLTLEALNGVVDGPGVKMRLAANFLAEAGFDAGYKANMLVSISQALPDGFSDVPVEVAIQVLATAVPAQTVWGNVAPSQWCNETAGFEAWTVLEQQQLDSKPLAITYGSTTSFSFTSCDIEGLPLRHSVPTERDLLPDLRRFTAELHNDTTGHALPVPVSSPASGRYVA
mmetsp:Transcript_2467/g.6827  ORF Transcript_2467/g.6827 Transcript_2467/m.6827 type:complete len:684 (+) Transcript_2467:104-2155(+)